MCCEERDSAQLERDLLNNRFKHLETELEAEKSAHTERAREVRGLEVSQNLLHFLWREQVLLGRTQNPARSQPSRTGAALSRHNECET